ncbi:MAG: 1-(5-phosphoribosyl)-5-[Anaerotignum sp.]|nr:1-(5-phosphoribosyl)-5-[(5-phosphoribosylamino)methylideneamino]imidazole-4-carboxamide isomerase [Anaerotignum sp.]MBQ7085229.1 1-(5-phosphoribosyl)-5-[(5-phosphoribosylamino)methylideneamino]imidazole-4-carboxamide isomerase [Anaerotignum sp.]MBR2062269.1 1-(5-phosphoribosyl)-5-[(5-phosphoribosylamino)methylideneamino]imidazole-4-carboxamide isomerase [Anaerotignum sp.]
MELFPAIDLIGGCAVRLVKGDYAQKTVYSDNPAEVAKSFAAAGAKYLHVVDLEGAKDGGTPNLETIKNIVENGGLLVEVGGGIRSEEVIKKYLDAGVFRVILGTAAVQNPVFLEEMVQKYGEKIAVGVDIKDGMVAIKGWTEVSQESCFDFCEKLQKIGVKTIICTDISKDGLLSGTNLELYKELSEKFSVDIVASGGVTTLDDVKKLADMGMYGAILGKALYTGNIDLKAAVELTKGGK